MTCRVVLTAEAEEDLLRLLDFLVERELARGGRRADVVLSNFRVSETREGWESWFMSTPGPSVRPKLYAKSLPFCRFSRTLWACLRLTDS